jgi:HSP20 family protein
MNKEDIEVKLDGNLLTISGERKSEEKEQNQKIYKEEQNYGYFARALTLPADVKTGDIKTEYNNGVLKVILPRISETVKTPGQAVKVPIQ